MCKRIYLFSKISTQSTKVWLHFYNSYGSWERKQSLFLISFYLGVINTKEQVNGEIFLIFIQAWAVFEYLVLRFYIL